ncbi:XdhC family protein [Haloarcula sp. JP-L23]|uniref:XdhC family protein n=1 Tax=Haloarcula sp. JP-L23 TaxID=2716717 RepID=UPI00140ED28A|nr:XdhC family protein [Haloarcula sp. JP-L23]
MSDPTEFDPWSASTATLYRELRRRVADDDLAVLATIVDVEGSAYRRPGAKMLVSPSNENLGAITAGCLEGPVADIAAQVLEDGQVRVETFDLMDDTQWGLGLGCNGIVDILLEPIDGSLDGGLAALEERDPVTVLTAVNSTDSAVSIGDRTLLDAIGDPIPAEDRESLPDELVASLRPAVGELRSDGGSTVIERRTDNGSVTIFVDCLEPIPRLLLFGSQNDVLPISRLGRQVGFKVIVASPRGAQASTEAFPHAHEVVASHPTDVKDHADELTYAVVMSHNIIDDRLALKTLLKETAVPYIGLMGPRERFEELREELSSEGTELTADQLERVSTPVGLDIGGGEPVHIALSIVSEVLAVHNGRSGGRLKDVEGPIHDRVTPPSS